MSDGAASGLDPRFDPRYQRGYAGGEASATDASPPRPAAERVPDTPAPVPAPESRAEPRTVAAREPSSPPRSVPGSEPATALDGTDPFVPEAEPSGPSVRAWLIAGWAVTIGILVGGASLSWVVNSDLGYYTGTRPSGDQWLRELGWTLSPSMLMAGSIGAVVITSLAALQHLQGDASADAIRDARFRRGSAWWALVSTSVIGIVAIVWAVGRAAEGTRANSTLVFNGTGTVEPSAEQAAAFAQISLGQFAQTMIGPLALAALAAFVAIVAVEVRRATISAERARSARPDRP